MAKIKLTSALCGERFQHQAGEVIEWDDREAKRMVDRGLAQPADEETRKALAKLPEEATRAAPPQQAAKRRPAETAAAGAIAER